MVVKIKIPFVLRKDTNQKEYIETDSGKLSGILMNISKLYPEIALKIMAKENKLKEYVMLFLEGENPKFISDNETEIKDGEIIRLIMVVGGG